MTCVPEGRVEVSVLLPLAAMRQCVLPDRKPALQRPPAENTFEFCCCPQEPRVQPPAVRAVQAEPGAAVHRQLCAKVLGGRPPAGQVRGRDPGELAHFLGICSGSNLNSSDWPAAMNTAARVRQIQLMALSSGTCCC